MKLQPHHHKYINYILLALGIAAAIFLIQLPQFKEFILHLGKFNYISLFISGILLVSTFTLPTGSLILITLAKDFPPYIIIALAGLGAAFGDFIVFSFVRDKVENEISATYDKFLQKHHLKKILHTKYFAWTLPVIGVLILASPLPDDFAVSLLGLSTMSKLSFFAISLLSHTVDVGSLIAISHFI